MPCEAIASAAREQMTQIMKNEPNVSTGLAAIRTLLKHLESSNATTVNELNTELDAVVQAMEATDYSSTSIRSGSNLFRRFISLAPADLIDQPDFSAILAFYNQRGQLFIERVARSRELIFKFSRPFLEAGMCLLTHSYSKVVLAALSRAHASGTKFKGVFVCESQPDASGRKMHKELNEAGIKATLVLDSAVGYLMERLDAVVVGAEGVVETGGIINKIGTLSIALCAKIMNKPVYVMAESIKFVKEYPLNQADIPEEFKYRSSVRSGKDLASQHPEVDYTPPSLITLLFTDLGILTPAAVGEELIKLYT